MNSPFQSDSSGLHEHEMVALVQLVRTLVGLHQVLSDEEADWINAVAGKVGEQSFWAHMQASYDQALTLDEVLRAAGSVTRHAARTSIWTCLFEIADSDGVDKVEGGLLDRLAHVWGLEVERQSPGTGERSG